MTTEQPSREESSSGAEPSSSPDRRAFLKAGVAAAGIAATGEIARGKDDAVGVQFYPEEYWRERMTAPDDGKKYGWIVDTRRCFGCHGCEVACKAENDVPLGSYIRQTIYHDFEQSSGQMARIMVPMSCQHCEDAPCIKACPCGALHKGAGGSVQIDYDTCCGHAACKEACPYGAIYIDKVANQAIKCHNCTHRLDVGLDPACVATCPSEALHFGDLNDPNSSVSRIQARMEKEAKLEVLRPEKGTRPRMSFAVSPQRPMSEWEDKVPGEGQSYHKDAYSVFEWGRADGEKKR